MITEIPKLEHRSFITADGVCTYVNSFKMEVISITFNSSNHQYTVFFRTLN